MDINQYQSIYVNQLAEARETLKNTESALKSAVYVRDAYMEMPGDNSSFLESLNKAISQLKEYLQDCQNEILIIEEKIVSIGVR